MEYIDRAKRNDRNGEPSKVIYEKCIPIRIPLGIESSIRTPTVNNKVPTKDESNPQRHPHIVETKIDRALLTVGTPSLS